MAASRTYSLVRVSSFLLYIIGILLSIYAYYVEFHKENDKDFIAACDISETMSCSKVFTSKYVHFLYYRSVSRGLQYRILVY